jgi:hypothetical protein
MDLERINDLLMKLNDLEQQYGRVPAEQDPNYDPSGEANARIQILKQELEQMGVQLRWDGWRYHIVETNDQSR